MSNLCLLSTGLFVAGMAGLFLGIVFLLYSARGPCRPRTVLSPDGYLVVSFGWCGEVRVPVGSIRSVKLVEDLGKGVRLFGMSIPGLHIGHYRFKGIGSVMLYSDKTRDVLLIETIDGKRIGLGFGAEKHLEDLEKIIGSGPRGRIETRSRAGLLTGLGLLLSVIGLVVVLIAYPHMASYSVFLGSRTDKPSLLLVGLIPPAIGFIDTVILYGLGSDNPVLSVIAPFSGLGALLVDASVVVAGLLCPA